MKHGDKAKAAKAKASGKEKSPQTGQKAGAKCSKAGESGKKAVAKSSKAGEVAKKTAKAPAEKSSAKGGGKAPVKAPGNGPARVNAVAGGSGFSNPVIGNAFKRAIKKFPNAFRKLTD